MLILRIVHNKSSVAHNMAHNESSINISVLSGDRFSWKNRGVSLSCLFFLKNLMHLSSASIPEEQL